MRGNQATPLAAIPLDGVCGGMLFKQGTSTLRRKSGACLGLMLDARFWILNRSFGRPSSPLSSIQHPASGILDNGIVTFAELYWPFPELKLVGRELGRSYGNAFCRFYDRFVLRKTLRWRRDADRLVDNPEF